MIPKRIIYVAVMAVIVLILIVAGLFHFQQPTEPRAAIIDQLSSSNLSPMSRFENQTFIDAATALLHAHFPQVDYYSDNATVDSYKNLASDGYKLIIWRAHSAIDESGHFVAISTSENNDTSDYPQYSYGQLTFCKILDDPKFYFAITPKFIAEVMDGRFDGTVIILMSCNGLAPAYTGTAEALKAKGATAVISWDEWIQSNDNDNAIELLLGYLFNENYTIAQAVNNIPEQSGPSILHYFPEDAANYSIPNYNKKAMTSNAWFDSMPTFQNSEVKRSSGVYQKLEVDSAKLLDVSTVSKRSRTTGYEELRRQD